MDFLYQLKQYNKEKKAIVLYCAGLHGKIFYEILKECGIKVDFFLDNSEDKWGKIIIDNIICLNPMRIKDHEMCVFICVGKKMYNQIYNDATKREAFKIVNINTFIDNIILQHKQMFFSVLRKHAVLEAADVFYDLMPNRGFSFSNQEVSPSRKKIIIYTAVFGGYDSSCYSVNLGSNYKYLYISDMKPDELPDYYEWLDAKLIIPKSITSPIKRNRYLKMNPHLFLGDYDYSIYIDGNVKVKADISELLIDSKSGISVFMHPMRECIYYEALSIANFKRVNVDDVCQQMRRYMDEGMPLRYGLAEMPVIVRNHMKQECIRVMETWWDEFNNESQRDQLSFMYAMWKNGMTTEDLGCLGYDVRNYEKLQFIEHINESKNIKNEDV